MPLYILSKQSAIQENKKFQHPLPVWTRYHSVSDMVLPSIFRHLPPFGLWSGKASLDIFEATGQR